MFFDDSLKHIPYFRSDFFHHSLGALDVVSIALLNKLFHDERFEQFKSHLFRQSALVELQFRSYYDNGTARIVDTLAEKVLSESSLFAFEHV